VGAVTGTTERAPRLHYAWVVVAVSFVVLLVAAGARSVPGTLLVPLEREFGWSRATVSVAVSVGLVCYALIGPFAAALMDRIGVRRVMVIALACIAGGSALATRVSAPWQLDLLWGVLVGVGTGSVSVTLGAIVANRWFDERRGLVMGIFGATWASGQLVFLPVVAWLNVHQGWRTGVGAVAIVVTCTIPLALLLMRERPSDLRLAPYGSTVVQAAPRIRSSPVRDALAALAEGARSRPFLYLTGAFFICGVTTNGIIGTHLIAAGHDHGLSEVTGASMLAAIGFFDVIGTLSSGWLTDRYDPRKLLFAYYGFRGVSLFFLPYALSAKAVPIAVFIVIYGLDWVATVPPTVAITAQLFGRERVGIFFAWTLAAHQLGAALAAWLAGAARGWSGDYILTFLVGGALSITAAFLSLSSRSRGVGAPSVA
jgi:MFS family permease